MFGPDAGRRAGIASQRVNIGDSGLVEQVRGNTFGELTDGVSRGARNKDGTKGHGLAVEENLVADGEQAIAVNRAAFSPAEIFKLGDGGDVSGENVGSVGASESQASAVGWDDEVGSVGNQANAQLGRFIETAKNVGRIGGVNRGGVVARAEAIEVVDSEFHVWRKSVLSCQLLVLSCGPGAKALVRRANAAAPLPELHGYHEGI